MKTGKELAQAAEELVKIGGTYQQADCQGFVERAFSRIGIRCNYRGSNDMIRNLAYNVQQIDNNIPVGALIFWVRRNGKEPERYKVGGSAYKQEFDGWNASHVGIYIGDGKVAESGMSIGHWATTDIKQRKATHYGLAKGINYANFDDKNDSNINISKQENNAKKDINIDTEYAIVAPPQGTLNIRTLADTKSSIVTRLRKWQLIKIQEYNSEWFRVYDIDGALLGYAMSKFIKVFKNDELQAIVKMVGVG